jgi:acyl dehydratase
VNAFGAATHDMQWIHTDPARANDGPYGRTIAHGYLTLSLATALTARRRSTSQTRT